MTRGNPLKLMIRFMVPVILGNIFSQFYNIMDTVIVGRCLGVQALAAVGATGSVSFLVFGFMNGLTTGFTIPIAQAYGEGNSEQMKEYLGNAIMLSAAVTVVMTIISVSGMDWMLRTMRVPADIFDMSKEYITVICAGMFSSIFYGIVSGILRAIGNSKAPLYFLIVAAFLNIILDFLFIADFKMGVAGAALATIISQVVSGLLSLIYIIKKVEILRMSKRHWKFRWSCCKRQIRIGIPMALQFSITAFGTMITQTALNTFGSTMVASFIVAGKVEQIVTQPFDAMGVTVATYCAQNWGIHNLDRVKKGTKIAAVTAIIYSVFVFLIVNPLVPYAVRIFVSENVEMVTGYARTYILISTSFFIPLGMILLFRNVLQGCGFAFIPMLGGVIELVSRSAAAFLAVYFDSYIGVCFANAAAWLTTGTYLVVAFFIVMRRMTRKESGGFVGQYQCH